MVRGAYKAIDDLNVLGMRGLAAACWLIAADSGALNRGHGPEDWARKLRDFLSYYPMAWGELRRIDRWLSTLDDDALETVAIGEELEQAEALRLLDAPYWTHDVLNRYHEKGM